MSNVGHIAEPHRQGDEKSSLDAALVCRWFVVGSYPWEAR